jgi:hypothetical protein
MNIRHASLDELPKLKLLATPVDFNRPQLSRPIVNVLKQMAVNRSKMDEIE